MKEGKKEKQAISFSCKNQKFSERWVGKRKARDFDEWLFICYNKGNRTEIFQKLKSFNDFKLCKLGEWGKGEKLEKQIFWKEWGEEDVA